MEPFSKRWAARAGIALASCTVAVGAVATAPAHAEGEPSLSASTMDTTLGVAGSPGKVLPITVSGNDVVAPKLTIDWSGLVGVASLEVPDIYKEVCTAGKDQKIDCVLPPGTFDYLTPPVVAHPDKSGKNGDSGTYKVITSAGNASTHEATGKVTLGDGADLVVIVPQTRGPLAAKPGDQPYTQISYTNLGNRAASSSTLRLGFDGGLVPFQYAGCTYTDTDYQTLVDCPIDEPMEPGTVLTFFTVADDGTTTPGFGATVADDALGSKSVDVYAQSGGVGEGLPSALKAKSKKATSGKKFVVKATSTARADALPEIDANDNFGLAEYGVANTHDIAAVGATASGAVGTTVKVKIGVKNVGKGALDSWRSGGEPSFWFTFAIPPGTEVVSIPANCLAEVGDGAVHEEGHDFYRCDNADSYFKPGETALVEFGLKITEAIDDAAGTVSFHDPQANPQDPPADADTSNDVAKVIINGTTTGGDNGGGDGSTLPITGSPTALIATSGAVLLAAGTVLLLLTRRRRAVPAKPKR